MIFHQDRKELHKDKSEKKEVKELTDKEKEREEKKKRWRKESPKKSAHHKGKILFSFGIQELSNILFVIKVKGIYNMI